MFSTQRFLAPSLALNWTPNSIRIRHVKKLTVFMRGCRFVDTLFLYVFVVCIAYSLYSPILQSTMKCFLASLLHRCRLFDRERIAKSWYQFLETKLIIVNLILIIANGKPNKKYFYFVYLHKWRRYNKNRTWMLINFF